MENLLQNKKAIQLIVSAVMALLFVNFYLKTKEQSMANSYGMVEVLVAARDISPHTQLTADYMTIQKVPLKFMDPGAYMVKIPQEAMSRIQGKVTIAAIPQGGQITQANLTDPSMSETGVAPLIPPGKRGYVLRLGNTDVADLILPGDHIDVIATFAVKQGENNSKATYTILQNILVIGVGRVIKRPTEGVTSKEKSAEGLNLTLALESTEAEKLALAQSESQGEISVIVRPRGENDIRSLPGVTPNHLITH